MTPTNVQKRKVHDEAEERSPLRTEFKKQKIIEVVAAKNSASSNSTGDSIHQQQHQYGTILGANELASAFALASLAMSPTQNSDPIPSTSIVISELGYESRDADNDAGSELDQQQSAVPISPDVRTPIRYAQSHPRRVTFANDTKLASRLPSTKQSLTPRVVISTNAKQQTTQKSRLPTGFASRQHQHFPHYPSSPRLTGQYQNVPTLLPQWMRQQQRITQHHHGPPALFMPPLHPRPPPDSSTVSTDHNKWICDFCNLASFETYEEACVHEGSCRARTGAIPHNQTSSIWPSEQSHVRGRGPQQPYLNLAMNHRSMVHIPSPPPPPPLPPANASTSWAVHRMRRNMNLNNHVDSLPSRNDVTTHDSSTKSDNDSLSVNNIHRTISARGSVDRAEAETSPLDSNKQEHMSSDQVNDGEDLVLLDDRAMVPPYVYFLMMQVESTHFTEADRFVARSKGPVGYSGFQCRHCHGHAGLGKYFPVTAKSLSTNSTSQNIHSHLLKCRNVSHYIKDQLIALKEEKSQAPRLEPGWRRIFFEKIWSRLHD
jgi:hypothetical protein